MKILISNTGRGGELAILTSIVNAYRKVCPNAYIRVTTSHNGVYHTIWQNSKDIDEWVPLKFRGGSDGISGKVIKCPLSAERDYVNSTKKFFDHQELTGEYDLSPGVNKKAPVRTILENVYKRLKFKPFTLDQVERKVFIWPTDEEHETAEKLIKKHGKNLVLLSHIANSAPAILNKDGYQKLADKISKTHPVAYMGKKTCKAHALKGHIDLRSTTFSFIYALSLRLKYYVGPDTATSWLVTPMPGLIIILRGGKRYPIGNTGLVAGGYRKKANTLELDLVSGYSGPNEEDHRIERVVSSLHSHPPQFVD